MIELVLFVLIIVIIVLFFIYLMKSESVLIIEKEKEIGRIEKMLKIAEKKFFKGKMKKEVFDELHDDLSSEKLNLELEINSIKKAEAMDANPKTDLLMQKTTNPSRHRKLLVKKLVKEVDLLRDEMFSIERKFLKHEIKESVFRKLMKEKENKLIRKESQIIEIVNEK